MRAFRHRLIGCCVAAALAVGLSACGAAKHPYDATAENNGFYAKLDGVYYQLQVSREFNQYAAEDSEYLAGLPTGTAGPTSSQMWFGVFVRAINKTNQTQTTSASFDIVDTQGRTKYKPEALDSTVNRYAWTSQSLQPLGTEPAPDTTAYVGPTAGRLLLFKLPTSVYANRPLTLEIHGTESRAATISLDL